jgi:tetratricopeptide (TPR) repeat protein
MATTSTSYSVLSLAEAGAAAADGGFGLDTAIDPDTGRRGRVFVRRDLDIGSFGVNAYYQAISGAFVIGEHDELGPGASAHEELYLVVSGGATFTVDGDEVEAPRGTAVFVSDPASKRAARATEDGTIVVVVGGRRGEAFTPGPGEGVSEFYRLYRAKDYEGALAVLQEVLEEHPGNALILYNIACIKSILGSPEEALEALAEAVAAWPKYKENAAADDDLAAVREDPRFQALLA